MDQVATVQLAADDTLYAEGTPVTLIGWGVDSLEMQSADTLQELEYKIANEEACKQHWEAEYKAYEDVLGVVDVELDMDSILGSCSKICRSHMSYYSILLATYFKNYTFFNCSRFSLNCEILFKPTHRRERALFT